MPTDGIGGVLVPRRMIYAQAVLLAAAAIGAFVAGYFIGTADDAAPSPARQGVQSIAVTGRLTVRLADGQSLPDEGAVILFLPSERHPRRDAKVDADNLSPLQPLPSADDPALAGVEALGGAYARTDRSGGFRVSLPQQGRYHVLAISRQLDRGDAPIDRVDLATIGEYVFDSISLIARQQHVLVSRDLVHNDRVDHEFRK
jgi:hypothetical protein